MRIITAIFCRDFPLASRFAVGLGVLTFALCASLIDVYQGFAATDDYETRNLHTIISCVSVTYLAGVAASWICTLGLSVGVLFLIAIRLGAIASLVCLIQMISIGYFCLLCVIVHGCVITFLFVASRCPFDSTISSRATAAMCCTFALVGVAMYLWSIEQVRSMRDQRAREQFQAKIDADTKTSPSNSLLDHPVVLGAETSAPNQSSKRFSEPVATRRTHLKGTAQASARLVVYYDYRNEQCRAVDQSIQELLLKYSDAVSVVARHYPASANGNKPLEYSARPNACYESQIVESAFDLKGEEAFWRIHKRLFDQLSSSKEEKLHDAIACMAIDDEKQLTSEMAKHEIMSAIFKDIVEARAIGVQNAPAVFLNGNRLTKLDAVSLEQAIVAVLNRDSKVTDQRDSLATMAIDVSAVAEFPESQQLSSALATVRIVNPSGKAVGSGVVFAVRGTFVYVLTAAHVAAHSKTVEVQTFSSATYPQPFKTHPWASVIASSEPLDLAVIRYSTRDIAPEPIQLADRSDQNLKSNFSVLTVGCEALESPPVCIASRVLQARRLRRNTSGPAQLLWEVESQSNEGRSGGPMFDKQGKVLGIASGNSDGKGYFCHLEEIYRFLSDNGLSSLAEEKPLPK